MRARLIANLGIAALFVAGCAVTEDDILESFRSTNADASDEQATCVVDQLINSYGVDGLEAELKADPVSREFDEQQFRTMIHCGMTSRLTEPMTAQVKRLDVPEETQACVVEALTSDITDADLDVLLSGEITDEYYAKFFDALTTCDALP